MSRFQNIGLGALVAAMSSCATVPEDYLPPAITSQKVNFANDYDVQILYGPVSSVVFMGKYKGEGKGVDSFDLKKGMIMGIDYRNKCALDTVLRVEEVKGTPLETMPYAEVDRIYLLVRILQLSRNK